MSQHFNRKKKNRLNNLSAKTRSVAKHTNHGFTEHNSLKEMHDFFTTDPDDVPGAHFEPPMFNKPTKGQLSRSEGKR